MRIAVDWSYKEDKLAVYDGKKLRKRLPTLQKGDQVYTENMPQKSVQKWLNDGVEIYRCRPNDTANYRARLGLPKTDDVDALTIWTLATEYPELFRRWAGDPVLTTMFRAFKEIQQARVRQGNRVWAKEEAIAKEVYIDLGAIEKKIEKAMKVELENYEMWPWLKQIKGINVKTAGGLIAIIDKLGIENVPTISALWSYFGLDVRDGRAPKLRKGTAGGFNPMARSLAIGIIADSFMKQRTPIYRGIYDSEKAKQLARSYPPGELASKWHGYKVEDTHLLLNHAHKRALRKVAKLFLSHLWVIWRQLKGLDTRPPYVHEQLKHNTYIKPPFIPEKLLPFEPFQVTEEVPNREVLEVSYV